MPAAVAEDAARPGWCRSCRLVGLAAISPGQQRSVPVAWFNRKWSKNLMTTGSRPDDHRSAFGDHGRAKPAQRATISGRFGRGDATHHHRRAAVGVMHAAATIDFALATAAPGYATIAIRRALCRRR